MTTALLPPAFTGTVLDGTGSVGTPLRLIPLTAPAPRRPDEIIDGTRLWRAVDAQIELSVVIPFYNPGNALRRTVSQLVECLREQDVCFEVIAVSDGSTDGSERTLDGLAPEVRVVTSPRNRGKGGALHLGFARARGAWVGMIDADGDIDPVHLAEYLHIARTGQHAAVYSDKRHTASSSASSSLRKLISIVYSTLVTMLFLLGVRDTQTGCKIFRRDVLAGVLPKLQEMGFAFDLEFFVAAKAAGITDLVPAPVRLGERTAGSTVGAGAILRTVRDTLIIFVRLHLHRQYSDAQVSAAGLEVVAGAEHIIRHALAAQTA